MSLAPTRGAAPRSWKRVSEELARRAAFAAKPGAEYPAGYRTLSVAGTAMLAVGGRTLGSASPSSTTLALRRRKLDQVEQRVKSGSLMQVRRRRLELLERELSAMAPAGGSRFVYDLAPIEGIPRVYRQRAAAVAATAARQLGIPTPSLRWLRRVDDDTSAAVSTPTAHRTEQATPNLAGLSRSHEQIIYIVWPSGSRDLRDCEATVRHEVAHVAHYLKGDRRDQAARERDAEAFALARAS